MWIIFSTHFNLRREGNFYVSLKRQTVSSQTFVHKVKKVKKVEKSCKKRGTYGEKETETKMVNGKIKQ